MLLGGLLTRYPSSYSWPTQALWLPIEKRDWRYSLISRIVKHEALRSDCCLGERRGFAVKNRVGNLQCWWSRRGNPGTVVYFGNATTYCTCAAVVGGPAEGTSPPSCRARCQCTPQAPPRLKIGSIEAQPYAIAREFACLSALAPKALRSSELSECRCQ